MSCQRSFRRGRRQVGARLVPLVRLVVGEDADVGERVDVVENIIC